MLNLLDNHHLKEFIQSVNIAAATAKIANPPKAINAISTPFVFLNKYKNKVEIFKTQYIKETLLHLS